MQGEKEEQEELFYYGSLDALVPPDDPFRRLEAVFDLEWLRRETRPLYSSSGRPSVDPVVIAKLLLIAYFEGIRSERELMRQVQVNLSYRRFIHYRLSEALPDHSNLTRARQRLGEATIRKVFEHVLRLCVDAHLVGGELTSIDSTFVKANASLKSLRPRLVAVEAARSARELFEVLDAQAEQAGRSDGDDDLGPPPRAPGGRLRRNEVVVSQTDPDSGVSGRQSGGTRLGYSVHFAVDKAHQVITGVLTTGAHRNDVGQLLPLVDQVRRRGIRMRAVAADRGYSSGEAYRGLAERDIEAFIPPLDHSVGRQGFFSREDFRYEPETDRYQCPNGAWLRRMASKTELRYRAHASDCAVCPVHALCTSGRRRSLKVSLYEAELAAARQRRASRAGRQAATARRVCSERTFAEAKEEHGLSRARWRRLGNVSMQAILTATVLNLKRYLRAQTRILPQAIGLREAGTNQSSSTTLAQTPLAPKTRLLPLPT